jgi:DNA-binding transcriptional MerR regulator
MVIGNIQMKNNLSKATFIIPVRIESQDRLRNVITCLCYLLQKFDTNIIIKEVDEKSVYREMVVPQIEDFLEDSIKNINHIFEYSTEPLFHRQRVLNEMIFESDTDIVVNYDCDVVLPVESYIESYNLILDGTYDIVYPYGQGMYQRRVNATDEVISDFISNDGDLTVLDANSNQHTSDYGWAQFFNRNVYLNGGMENENFRAYAPEDLERFYRFKTLGYNIGRIDKIVYHLEHSRGENSWFNNPHMESNTREWEKLKQMDKQKLIDYYSKQEYLKKYDVSIQSNR